MHICWNVEMVIYEPFTAIWENWICMIKIQCEFVFWFDLWQQQIWQTNVIFHTKLQDNGFDHNSNE